MGNLGVPVKGGHDGRMVETVTVDDDGVGVHCRGFVFGVIQDDVSCGKNQVTKNPVAQLL